MKKYLIYTFLIGLFLSACNPNKDIYDAIENAQKPYSESFDIELSDADYTSIKKLALQNAQNSVDSAIANDLDTYKSFSVMRSAADLIPAFLADKYIAPDSASSIKVKYHYSVNEYDSLQIKTAGDDDYLAMFGTTDTCFSSAVEPSDYLNTLDTTSNYFIYFNCRYGDSFASAHDTSIVYTFINGSWKHEDNFYILTNADYESMGAPGAYHNFSDSEKPEHYLPTFLHNNYPYAYEKDVFYIFYKYYSGGTQTLADAYMFDGSTWSNTSDKISTFIHNGTEWVFDPTVHYTMSTAEDYQIIVDYVTNNPDIPDGYLDPAHPTTSEYYYGANSYYKNFYLKLYKRRQYDPLGLLEGLSDDEASTEILNRINEAIGVFLEAKFPNAEPVLNGVQVNYAITYNTYGENSVRNKYTVTYKCIGTGQFEYLSGPELVE